MTARVDGPRWTAVPVSVAAIPGQRGLFAITGTETVNNVTQSINLLFYNIRGPGTYPFGVSTEMVGGTAQYAASGNVWSTPINGASGTFTITTLTPTRIVGEFEYTAQVSAGTATPQTRSITEGEFDIPMTTPSGSLPVVPDNAGSVVKGLIGGTAFNAATASVNASNLGNGLGFNSHNSKYQLQVSLAGVTAKGTYSLNQPASRYIAVTGFGGGTSSPQCCWGANAGDVGTVTITDVTATRLKGNLTATLRPATNSTQTQPLTVSGDFDIGRL